MITLLTRGDDAGSYRSANLAMRDAVTDGILRNIGLMAPCAHLEHAAEVLLPLADQVCFGVHLTLTAEWDEPRWGSCLPAAQVPSLLQPDGTFPPATGDVWPEGGHGDPDEAIAEAQKQYETIAALGFKLGYVDCHMGIDWYEPFQTKLAAWARERGLIYASGKSALMASLTRLPQPVGTYEHLDLAGKLLDGLRQLPDGVTTMSVQHPCYNDEETRAVVRQGNEPGFMGPDRDAQRLAFMREDVVTYVRENNIRLPRFDEVYEV